MEQTANVDWPHVFIIRLGKGVRTEGEKPARLSPDQVDLSGEEFAVLLRRHRWCQRDDAFERVVRRSDPGAAPGTPCQETADRAVGWTRQDLAAGIDRMLVDPGVIERAVAQRSPLQPTK